MEKFFSGSQTMKKKFEKKNEKQKYEDQRKMKNKKLSYKKYPPGSGGIRTHASEETGALNQRLRPLGHATVNETPPFQGT